MTLSIITPSYNQGKFIEDTIKSVLDQAGDFSIQYIIADGGSTDETVSIIKKYDELLKNNQYPIKCKGITLTWWSRKDNGQAAAINEGFRLATGDILAWVNSDDFYTEGVFQRVLELLPSGKAVLCGNSHHVNAEARQLFDSDILRETQYDFALRDYIIQPSTFITAEAWRQVGPLRENVHFIFDWIWYLDARKKGVEFRFVPDFFSVYRIHEAHKTGTGGKVRDKEIAEAYRTLKGERHEKAFRLLCVWKRLYYVHTYMLGSEAVGIGSDGKNSALRILRLTYRFYRAVLVFVLSLIARLPFKDMWQMAPMMSKI